MIDDYQLWQSIEDDLNNDPEWVEAYLQWQEDTFDPDFWY